MAQRSQTHRRNIATALLPAGIALCMAGLAFAAVPLYDLFCRVTGFGGTTQVATDAPARLGTKKITIRFDANVVEVPWRFSPETEKVTVTTGETKEIRYRIASVGDRPTIGVATYNVVPEQAGAYFNKLACFCFTNQTLKPHEAREETVVFFVDPAIENDPNLAGLDTITLSYTFMPPKDGAKPLASAAASTQTKTQ
jgi:cytochrome c oxidase assembly protein subunit 11